MPYFRSKRFAPRVVRFVAIFCATVSGEPTYSAPLGPISRRKDSSVGMANPRVLLTDRITSR